MSIGYIIFVKNLANCEVTEIEIDANEKIKDLKEKIENLTGMKLSDNYRIHHPSYRKSKKFGDENRCIKDSKIRNHTMIIVGIQDVLGGK